MKQDLSAGYICKSSMDDEPELLAFNPDGSQRALTREQPASVRRSGNLPVPSRQFSGQHHVWKLNWPIQQGSHPPSAALRRTSHPARLPPGARRRRRFCQKGVPTIGAPVPLHSIVSSLVGLPVLVPQVLVPVLVSQLGVDRVETAAIPGTPSRRHSTGHSTCSHRMACSPQQAPVRPALEVAATTTNSCSES